MGDITVEVFKKKKNQKKYRKYFFYKTISLSIQNIILNVSEKEKHRAK